MSGAPSNHRPKRWDMPFSREREGDRELTDLDVERVLTLPPFRDMDESSFRQSLPLRGILKNDVRLVSFQRGDIIVREGDWGNSAFYIVKGTARVELEPEGSSFPDEILGRSEVRRKSFFEVVAQLWNRRHEPEIRESKRREHSSLVGRRGTGQGTRIYLQDVSAVLDQYRTAMLESGQWFGEIAALGRTQRVATVFAETEVEILEIRWQGLRDLMRNDADGRLRKYIEKIFRERALSAFLRNEPVFDHLDPQALEQVVRQTQFESIGSFDSVDPYKSLKQRAAESRVLDEPVVAEQGEHPYGVILIRSGVARISRKHHHGYRTVGYLTPGQAYGVEEILEGWKNSRDVPLKYRLSAIGYLNVVVVPTVVIERHVLEQGRAADLLELCPQQQTAPVADDVPAEKLDESMLEFFVGRGYVQGTATMLIDLDRCTRCDDCVRACATAHDNNPRFLRHGPIHDHFMVANACMHCADPVCMIECPTGAIHRTRLEGSVIINDQTCIGCAQCANNCPYDAIRMVNIRDESGNLKVDEKSKPLIQATKCDLCVDQWGGPSCQRACPHDALKRIDMRNLVALQEYVDR